MAKEQNLSLNPTKISGLCGRLICCLNFEKDFYNEMNEKLPALDEMVMSPKGTAQVVSTYPLKESVRVKYTNPDGSTDTAIFHLNEITRINPETKKFDADENDIINKDLSPEELAELVEPEENAVSVMTKQKHKIHNNRQKTQSRILPSELLESGAVPVEIDENREQSKKRKVHKKHKQQHTEERDSAENALHIDGNDDKQHMDHHEKNHNAKKRKTENKNKTPKDDMSDVTANAEQNVVEHKKVKKPRPQRVSNAEGDKSNVKNASDDENSSDTGKSNSNAKPNSVDIEKSSDVKHHNKNKHGHSPKSDNSTSDENAQKGKFKMSKMSKMSNKNIKIQERSANVKPTDKKVHTESNKNEMI